MNTFGSTQNMNSPSPLFCCQGLSFQYPATEEYAIRDLSCEILHNSFTVFVGSSGSGKSTLLNLLSFLDAGQMQGSISYRGQKYGSISAANRVRIRRSDFGFVLQDSYLMPNLTCRENLSIPLMLNGKSETQAAERVEKAALSVGLIAPPKNNSTNPSRPKSADNKPNTSLLDSYPNQVSGGQRQRIAFLRALIHDPAVVLADEPFASLDSDTKDSCLEFLHKWKAGAFSTSYREDRTVLMITHDEELAASCADQIFRLKDGRLVECLAT